MHSLQATKPQPYRFRDKVKPFCRGLLSGQPFVEVAREGLKRGNLGRDKRALYGARISGETLENLCSRWSSNSLTRTEQNEIADKLYVLVHNIRLRSAKLLLAGIGTLGVGLIAIRIGLDSTGNVFHIGIGLGFASIIVDLYNKSKLANFANWASNLISTNVSLHQPARNDLGYAIRDATR